MTLARSAALLLSAILAAGPAQAQRADQAGRAFSDLVRNSEIGTGLFTIYFKHDSIFLSLRPSQLDHDYLLVTQVAQGIGDLGLDGGTSLRSDLVRFHREGDRLELWAVNPHLVAPAGTPMARTVAYSFGSSVVQSFPIAAVRDTSEIVVNILPFFLSDWADVGTVFQTALAQRKLSGSVSLDEKRSSLQFVRLFGGNLEAEVRLTFQTPRNLGLEAVADYRAIPVGIHYSLREVPAVPMRPRLADDRVGFFVTAVKDYARDTADSYFVRYINRWRLEKRHPGAPLSEPVQPITYYIDRTVPVEWRPYVRAGILEWNRAFEDAGFRDAIQVLDAPDDSAWSAADTRYSTVRWTATNAAPYAIGPVTVDPRSGEILNADILIAASWVQRWRGQSGRYVAPVAAARAALQDDSSASSMAGAAADAAAAGACRYADALGEHGALVAAVMASRGEIPAGGEPGQAYVGQALKALVMHEVGHTLGLRHNFRGSAGASAAQLANRAWTAAHGFGVSVMDYSPPALALDGARQGDYYSPTIGSYDRWAITYGYADVAAGPVLHTASKGSGPEAPAWTPEVEVNGLRAIASEAADPAHLYASDEDAGFGTQGLDPTVSRYDQTDDPLGWARGRVGLINGLFDSLETRVVAPGESYDRLRSTFTDLLNDRWYALLVTTKYLGGATTSRDHRDDPGARPPVANVPAAQQRAALAFVAEAGLGEQAYRFRPALLNRLATDRWMHWGASPGSAGRPDFPLHEWALTQQGSLLGQLLDPAVLARIRDAELRAEPGEATLGLPELFGTLTRSIWSEIGAGVSGRTVRPRNVTSVRRDLQRLQLNLLIQLAVSPPGGTPEDARALARMTLVGLGGDLDRALGAPRTELDEYTRAHLADARERIGRALDAQMIQTTTFTR
ncbi:MAG TPA: zinc-dependent metalloprotease [Gemmatimonadales bacterium]|nr:zinc-dependent metalloprotease [Gemmatimonadales bacterium]